MRLLLDHEAEAFINRLGHSPQTTLTIHAVRKGTADVYLHGEAGDFRAAVVQEKLLPAEPTGFGHDAAALWAILSALHGWDVINLDPALADDLAPIMGQVLGVSIRRYGDIYYQMNRPAVVVPPRAGVAVRLLNPADMTLAQAAAPELQPGTYGSIAASLARGLYAGAIAEGRLVALSSGHPADRYMDIGVITDAAWRGQGLATAAASLLAVEAQRRGLVPVWSVGADNAASHRVAHKLGFERVGERVYLIPTF